MEPRSNDQEAIHREMYRKSRDIIRVYNPLTIDFRFKWDGIWNVVKAKQSKDVERYLAEKFFIDISNYILDQMALTKGKKMIEERKAKGMVDFLNKYEENVAIWNNVQISDNNSLREIASQVILGLVEEYGVEEQMEFEVQQERANSMVPESTVILNEFSKKLVDNKEQPQKPLMKKFGASTQPLADEVTVKPLV